MFQSVKNRVPKHETLGGSGAPAHPNLGSSGEGSKQQRRGGLHRASREQSHLHQGGSHSHSSGQNRRGARLGPGKAGQECQVDTRGDRKDLWRQQRPAQRSGGQSQVAMSARQGKDGQAQGPRDRARGSGRQGAPLHLRNNPRGSSVRRSRDALGTARGPSSDWRRSKGR